MKRILVVDDDDNLREVLSAVLSQDGHAVDGARGGAEALDLLDQGHYNLILSDLRMPGFDGPSLYEVLRTRSRVPTRFATTLPRLIFMTGNAGLGDYTEFLKGTTEPMLEKPFNLAVVRQMVKVLLEGASPGSQSPAHAMSAQSPQGSATSSG